MITAKDVQFFGENAGVSCWPGEPMEKARARSAWRHACAEAAARLAGARFDWSVDPHATSGDWCDEDPPWQQWQCALVLTDDGKDVVHASVGGVDLGPDGTPSSEDYSRVIQAELAMECLPVLLSTILAE